MQRTKNFSQNIDDRLLSPFQKQIEIERQLEQKNDCKIIEGQHNISLETWKHEGLTYLQILKYGLSKGCYGRLSYRNNPQTIQSDLTKALSLTCEMQFETASTVATQLIDKLKVYEKEAYQRMKAEREQLMMRK